MARAQRAFSYVLRLWQAGDQPPVWQITLHDARTGERRAFADLTQLMAFLGQQIQEEVQPVQDGAVLPSAGDESNEP